jgi:hypothetical protein
MRRRWIKGPNGTSPSDGKIMQGMKIILSRSDIKLNNAE